MPAGVFTHIGHGLHRIGGLADGLRDIGLAHTDTSLGAPDPLRSALLVDVLAQDDNVCILPLIGSRHEDMRLRSRLIMAVVVGGQLHGVLLTRHCDTHGAFHVIRPHLLHTFGEVLRKIIPVDFSLREDRIRCRSRGCTGGDACCLVGSLEGVGIPTTGGQGQTGRSNRNDNSGLHGIT